MPNQVLKSVEKNFTKGLVTEFTGLNFPENAATDCDNVTFDIKGNVYRRLGIDLEDNYITFNFGDRNLSASNTYKWKNAGGDGITELIVCQTGDFLRFYESSNASITLPLSQQWIGSVDISTFVDPNVFYDPELECQFADGNGYLFVYHPTCEPFYVTYAAGVLTANQISVQIRDFTGVVDGLLDNQRPSTLSTEHEYNLQNQGWVTTAPWFLQSTSSVTCATGVRIFTVAAGITGIAGGQNVLCQAYMNIGSRVAASWMAGTVTSYVGTTLTLNITTSSTPYGVGPFTDWDLTPGNIGYVQTWFTSQGNYPSNADQWWRFKDSSGVFNPTTTQPNTSISLGAAPKGHYILPAFNQNRSTVSGLTLTQIVSTKRPSNGCWFQGRVWYTGVNSSQAASGSALFTTWTENIYFSQVVNKVDDFGKCYQKNDPTSEELFDLLPTDGGVIVIQGCGPIYKLFPIQNGLLVFAANGVWFITGSQGIGFAATDYTITKISSIGSLSTCSFVDVQGLPYFWNEDGIYAVQPQQGGGLGVISITETTISAFYDAIPRNSKIYARGAYNPIEHVIQWLYRETTADTVLRRYSFDKILNFNVLNKSFYPYSVTTNPATSHLQSINGINYVEAADRSDANPSQFMYFSSFTTAGTWQYAFAAEYDEGYVDWRAAENVDYDSYFVTGYKLHGDAQRRFQIPYIYMYSNNETDTAYYIQSLWDYATSGNSGRWSTNQYTVNSKPNFGLIVRRHRLRGQGLVLQIKVSSVEGEPFDIAGWSAFETQNMGV
jgi:hypothetical protein